MAAFCRGDLIFHSRGPMIDVVLFSVWSYYRRGLILDVLLLFSMWSYFRDGLNYRRGFYVTSTV